MKKDLFNNFAPQEMASILDSISDAIFIDDSDGFCLWCNRACRSLYDIEPQDLIGLHVLELERTGIFSPSVADIVMKEKREVTIIHENRNGRKLLSTGTPLFDEDGSLRWIITTSRDISELSLLQNRLENITAGDADENGDALRRQGIIARSEVMVRTLQLARRLAPVDSTILITGESGVGKGVITTFIHNNGPRRKQPLITVNCGAIPENLIESELFGYEKGAFTGARAEGKKGYFEAAQNGTIFLDEISELPLPLQVKLLQVIQERQITRVGGTEKIPINVRIISATNRDLQKRVEEGRFREDLYYRLNVIPITVPPLRERREDIRPLIAMFLGRFNEKYGQNMSISRDALHILEQYSWPGNIRELQNIIERLVLTGTSVLIDADNLPEYIIEESRAEHGTAGGGGRSLNEQLDAAERDILARAARRYPTTRALARALQTSQPTIVRKLHKYGLHPGRSEAPQDG
ncbi:MAG: sigma-54 interaction domain-containing protein [Anaerovoracaceae bacterium]|jgi:TyrR family helix-turn-helix protein